MYLALWCKVQKAPLQQSPTVENPRFGRVRSVVSLRRLQAGEEITVDYGYSLEERSTPAWYTRLHHRLEKRIN